MSLAREIADGYNSMFTHGDHVDAFQDFRKVVEVGLATPPIPETATYDEIVEINARAGERSLAIIQDATDEVPQAIRAARRSKHTVFSRLALDSKPVTDTNGIVIVGDTDGNLLGADYSKSLEERGVDQIELAVPNYFPIALVKVGAAALVHLEGWGGLNLIEQAKRLQEILETESTRGHRQYIGYACNSANPYVAGASGVMPSAAMREHLASQPWYDDCIESALASGELPEQGHVFEMSGWMDYYAAQSAITFMRYPNARHSSARILPTEEEAADVNLN